MELTESVTRVESRLRKLCWMGFLEESGEGFAMHPFIAECLGNRRQELEDCFFERVLERIVAFLNESETGEFVCCEDGRKTEFHPDALSEYLEGGMLADTFAKEPQIGEICRILLYYETKLQVSERSERQTGILLLAIEATGQIYGFSEEMYRKLAQIRQEYPGLPFAWRLRCLIMEAYNEKVPSEEYEWAYAEYAQHDSDPEKEKDLYEYFCVAYIRTLMHDGKSEKAMELCTDFFEKIKNAKLKMEISKYAMKILSRKNAFRESAYWIKKSENLLSPESDVEIYREFLMQKGRYYFNTEQWELFQEVQEEFCSGIQETDLYWQYDYFYWRGLMELIKHQDEKAVKSFESARDYARAYFGKNHTNVAYVDQGLGVCLCNMEQYEKALFYTEEACHIFARYPGEKFMERRLKNNIGHLKMKMGKLTEALTCLTDLYDEFVLDPENRDIVILAQLCDNLAETCHKLENEEEERRWLAEAAEYRKIT